MDGDDVAYPCKGCGEVSTKISLERPELNFDCSDTRRRQSI